MMRPINRTINDSTKKLTGFHHNNLVAICILGTAGISFCLGLNIIKYVFLYLMKVYLT